MAKATQLTTFSLFIFLWFSWTWSAQTWSIVIAVLTTFIQFKIPIQRGCCTLWFYFVSMSPYTCFKILATLWDLMHFWDSYTARLMHLVVVFQCARIAYMRYSNRDITKYHIFSFITTLELPLFKVIYELHMK